MNRLFAGVLLTVGATAAAAVHAVPITYQTDLIGYHRGTALAGSLTIENSDNDDIVTLSEIVGWSFRASSGLNFSFDQSSSTIEANGGCSTTGCFTISDGLLFVLNPVPTGHIQFTSPTAAVWLDRYSYLLGYSWAWGDYVPFDGCFGTSNCDYGAYGLDYIPSSVPVARQIPEPGTLALFGAAVIGLAFTRRRTVANGSPCEHVWSISRVAKITTRPL